MTPERLTQLRLFARYVAYHVPVIQAPDALNEANAGTDMLELCDAAAAASELLAACRDAIAGCRAVAENWPDERGINDTLSQYMATVRAAIAKAEGR
jgi:hypothetical protein